MKRVYLAGKIYKNDWRHSLFPGLRGAAGDNTWPESHDLTRYPWGFNIPAAVDGWEYVGPFFISCDHGCYHLMNEHGLGVGQVNCQMEQKVTRKQVVTLCQSQIATADAVFCWLENLTAYGTLAELGYASALGKPICLAYPDSAEIRLWENTWFVKQLAGRVDMWPNVEAAWQDFLGWSAFIEDLAFIEASAMRETKKPRTAQDSR